MSLRNYFAGRYAAQEARNDMRSGDNDYSRIGKDRWSTDPRAATQAPASARTGAVPPQANTACVALTPQRTKADAGSRSCVTGAGAASSPPIPERDVLAVCLAALRMHPAIAWAQRMNVGAFQNPAGQYVRVGFKGCSDIIGQTKGGRFVAVECKREDGQLTDDQRAFLHNVQRNRGVAIVARSLDDLLRGLRANGV